MAIGIIAEFNPFHNGHKYLIEQAKQCYNEPIVIIMSGSFVQRGDIAITDKWTRAGFALNNGADLVFELPVTFSMNTAQKFAFGAVYSLAATGVVDKLVFGSESGNSSCLKKAAYLTANEPPEVSAKIKQFMSIGMNYPSARDKAFGEILNSDILSSPNDILAIEYIRAASECNAGFEFIPITRTGASHDSNNTTDTIASASEIRRRMRNGENTKSLIPYSDKLHIYDSSLLDTAVIAKLRTMDINELKNINDVSEGLENRIKKATAECDNITDLCMAVKSKRYTLSRIRRIIWSAMLGLTKELCSLSPDYLRILGMNDTGKVLLKEMKASSSLPVITKAANFSGSRIFDINSAAEDIFSLAAPSPALRKGGRDITISPVVI